MALTHDFRETVQARVRRDSAFRKGLLRDAIEALLAGEVVLGKELLRDYINATVGFPKLARYTKLHVKTLHQMFGPKGNPTASNLFVIVAYQQRQEGVRFQVRTRRAVASRPEQREHPTGGFERKGTDAAPAPRRSSSATRHRPSLDRTVTRLKACVPSAAGCVFIHTLMCGNIHNRSRVSPWLQISPSTTI